MSARVPFRFHPAFRELPAQWLVLSYHKRSLLQDLWRLSADDCSGWIETARDPAQFLACTLDIRDRRDRQNAVRAIRELISEGFVEVVGERCRVHQTSIGRSTSCTPVVAPDVTPADSQVPENKAPKTPRKREQKEEREEARELFRKPVGEPPPGFVDTFQEQPKELSLEDKIINAWKEAVHSRTLEHPGSTKRVTDSAAAIAKWLRESPRHGSEPLAAFQAALKQYVADEKLRDKAWPLNWLLDRMPGYLAAKQSEQQSVSSPTHLEWVPPDYERENREAEAREDADREKWFDEHPEYRARYEERRQQEMAEERRPRLVISNEPVKPPVGSYRPKTADELAARRAELAEQERQIRAANAAKQ